MQHFHSKTVCFLSINCFFIGLFVLILQTTIAQPILNKSIKGERPPINLEAVSPQFYEAGKLLVKFMPTVNINQIQLFKYSSNNVVFNIPALDSINKIYGITNASLLFKNILEDSILQVQHHEAGLHLWYQLHLSKQTNLKQVIKAYQSTHLFQVVEPVYKASVIAPPSPFIPNDVTFPLQWNLKNTGQSDGVAGKDISMTDAWGITTGDTNVIVSVHDNAININHPDLAQNIAYNKSFNFIDNNSNLTLNSSHGSHCAGIIAAVNNNTIGVSGIAGGNGNVTTGARLMSCEIFGPNETSNGLAESLIYAADHGSVVSNNSWGYDTAEVYDEAVLDAIDYYAAYGGGKVLSGGIPVFASGNNGKNWRLYPGAYSKVICVAATNNKDKLTYYSNFGKWVDICAPGGESFWGGGIYSTENSSYSSSSGTSFACPQVVGVAALVAGLLKGKASASDVRDIILSTTDNNYPLNPNYVGLMGTGRLNAYTALLKAQKFLAKSNSPILSFSAQTDCNSIKLNWKDSLNTPVIIAYNSDKDVNTLADGISYTIGDTLTNDGIIIYKGTDTTFTFPLIDSIYQYNFKIWGVTNNNQYSFSKALTTFTKPTFKGTGADVIKQNFDYPPIFPTKIWHGTNTKYDFGSWVHTANDTNNTGAGDEYSMCMYNYQYDTSLGICDTLSGPYLYTKGADSISLSFWRAYQFLERNLPYSDTLEVIISTDCGKTFSSLWKKGGKELSTGNDTTHKAFYPFGVDKWKQEYINLSNYNGFEKVLIGFRGYNGMGNNLFVDNINMSVRYKTDVAVTSIIQPLGSTCNNQIQPTFIFKNVGNRLINKLKVGYQLDGASVDTLALNISLPRDSAITITLKPLDVSVGNHSIKIFSYAPNNIQDDFKENDTLVSTFIILPQNPLPVVEGFEGNTYPPNGWELTKSPANDNFSWAPTTNSACNSVTSVFIQNFINKSIGNTYSLITAPMSINNPLDSVFLLFDVAATSKADSTTTQPRVDTLSVDITNDCGVTFKNIYKHWGTNLQTATPQYTEFIPTSQQWRRDSINVSAYVNGGDLVRFRFTNTNKNSNNIYIDNISIYSKTLYNLLRDKGLLVYPNPVKNNLIIKHFLPPTTLQSIEIYNAIGKRVRSINYKGANASVTELINITNLAAGFYVVQLNYTDKRVVEKILKMDK